MKVAVVEALNAYGQTSPNPTVGAVVVKAGKVLARGFHDGAGKPHAEIGALKKAGSKSKGATLYVTLEPCCHFGSTPPCTDAIIRAGIKRVVYGMLDPNPLISGEGIKRLRSGGIKIVGPVMEETCKKLNPAYIKWMKTGSPYVTVKIALTLDGKIADHNGDSKWITGEMSREYVHMLRSMHDVVMVGRKTYDKDKPKLNVRLPNYTGRQPLPMVVGDRSGKRVDLKKLFKELGAAGFQSIMVEGGGELHSELLSLKMADRIVAFIAPKIFGGRAISWTGKVLVRKANRPVKIEPESVFSLGGDIVIEGRPVY